MVSVRFSKEGHKYLGGQPGDQAWKVSRHRIRYSRIGVPTGRYVKPWALQDGWNFWVCDHFNESVRFSKEGHKYLGGQPGDQAWKVRRHRIRYSRIGVPTGRYAKP